MRQQMPTDPTMPNAQDPKNAPHSPDGGVTPYVPAWERLPDAIKRVTAGGRPKDQAQTELCQAIADRTVKIRGKLERHTTRHLSASDTVLQGTDFQVPVEIRPAELDWGRSRPLKPWMVRRGSFSPPGYWDLEWIEVCTADVTNVFCSTEKPGDSVQPASSETGARHTNGPALENQEAPIGSGPRSPAGPRKSDADRPARRRGPRPQKFERTKDAMRNDLQQKRHTVAQLENMLEKHLSANYGVSRDVARKARKAVLLEFNSRQTPTNDK
jgi:hypothetical protein